MGLMIHSLDILSKEAKRDYFIYLLDYGWHEPLSKALRSNFQNLAEWATKNDSAVIMGVGDIGHFDNEVLSFHSINGEKAEKLLPAILITRTNPHIFKSYSDSGKRKIEDDLKFILIPLKKFCETETDVISLIKKISQDIEAKKGFSDFKIQKELKRNVGKAIIKSIILEPNFAGLGFSFNKLVSELKS